jgi:hypothetical protein
MIPSKVSSSAISADRLETGGGVPGGVSVLVRDRGVPVQLGEGGVIGLALGDPVDSTGID